MRGINWIPDENRHGLSAPPEWFLDELWAYDDQLVLIPSRRLPLYRLTRRTRRTAGLKFIADLAKGLEIADDSRMMADHGLIPVGTMNPNVPWSPQAISDLACRDIWRVGGAEKAADILDKQDKSREEAIDKKINDELTERVNRSYESYRYRTGQRLSMVTPNPRSQAPSDVSSSDAVS